MKKIIIMSLGLIASCGGGNNGSGGSNKSIVGSEVNELAGIYAGALTPSGGSSEDAVTIITSDNRIAIVDLETEEVFFGKVLNQSVSGVLYSSSVISATGTVVSSVENNISGTYSSSLGGGSFSMEADSDLYSRGASLNQLEGTWVDSENVDVSGVTTWIINSDGSFTMESTSNCFGTGQFSLIDETKNEYSVSIVISNCSIYNSTYTGIGILSDTYNINDSLGMIFQDGSAVGLFEPIKQ